MSASWKADELVLTRSDNQNRFKHNFLKQAVCELRFPTLIELGEQRPPSSFVKALRKDYPILEMNNEFTLGVGSNSAGSSNVHVFRSAKSNWSISLKENSIAIETTTYSGFSNLRERILQVIDAAEKIIDSDFFTRIGLRYINILKTSDEDITAWVNPLLTASITSRHFIGINDFGGRMQLLADDGGCLLQHGIQLNHGNPEQPVRPSYLIDTDTYRTEVLVSDALDAVDVMHRQAFDIFDWSITEKAREFLSTDLRSRKGV
ncbi:TIGR04255 family protein [Pseudomonas sp. TH34]|uniref:TIGR04255 family protein n=1 Tax=Pseudomonas yamanorum TaxID=515393 RepID=A0AAJ3H973_9PSED|nr:MULTISPECIES: TIGR04255 family protein [Pseudomonas]MBK5412063.1 TIGR04255 family protein [Pseudomonas sp. TH34]NWD44422.1 TIGR04255 family protein [Pseudomonas yamanorum]